MHLGCFTYQSANVPGTALLKKPVLMHIITALCLWVQDSQEHPGCLHWTDGGVLSQKL